MESRLASVVNKAAKPARISPVEQDAMQITDAQIHIWRPDHSSRSWITDGAAHAHGGRISFGIDEVVDEMNRAGVHGAILVGPSWEGSRNDFVEEAVMRFPHRFRGLAHIDLEAGEEQLAEVAASSSMLGVRALFARETESWLSDGRAEWLWSAAEELGIPVTVFAPQQQRHLMDVAERFPSLRLVICHLGLRNTMRDEVVIRAIDETLRLAEFPNVAVKATSLPSYWRGPFPFAGLQEQIERVVAAFGPERVFWGSDLSRLTCTYRELVDLFTVELSFLGQEALEFIMGEGLRAWMGWDGDAARNDENSRTRGSQECLAPRGTVELD